MSASSVIYAIDLPKLEAFYTGALGMPRVEAGPTHVVLESEGWELILIQAPKRITDTVTITDPPKRRADAPTKLVFAVRNIDAIRQRAEQHGGLVDPEAEQRVFRGSLRSDGFDPEGNIFQLRQLGTVS